MSYLLSFRSYLISVILQASPYSFFKLCSSLPSRPSKQMTVFLPLTYPHTSPARTSLPGLSPTACLLLSRSVYHALHMHPQLAFHLHPRFFYDLIANHPSLLDSIPRLWAVIVQIFDPQPSYLASNSLSLADIHLPPLQTILFTPALSLLMLYRRR